jgi:energy-converting hydrogenase Eha subunit C
VVAGSVSVLVRVVEVSEPCEKVIVVSRVDSGIVIVLVEVETIVEWLLLGA